MDFSDLFQAKEYSFLREDEHLGRRVILLGISGSRGYGTESENSDVDLRGITLNRRSDLIGLSSYEQFVDEKTDTVIYAFNKVIPLLLSCNPNTMELLGLCPEHYLFLHEIGKELIERRGMFLSKRAAADRTELPDEPDMRAVEEFVMQINERVQLFLSLLKEEKAAL